MVRGGIARGWEARGEEKGDGSNGENDKNSLGAARLHCRKDTNLDAHTDDTRPFLSTDERTREMKHLG